MSPSTQDTQSGLRRRATGFVPTSDLTSSETEEDDIIDTEQSKADDRLSTTAIQELAKIKKLSKSAVHVDDTKYEGDELVSNMIKKR